MDGQSLVCVRCSASTYVEQPDKPWRCPKCATELRLSRSGGRFTIVVAQSAEEAAATAPRVVRHQQPRVDTQGGETFARRLRCQHCSATWLPEWFDDLSLEQCPYCKHPDPIASKRIAASPFPQSGARRSPEARAADADWWASVRRDWREDKKESRAAGDVPLRSSTRSARLALITLSALSIAALAFGGVAFAVRYKALLPTIAFAVVAFLVVVATLKEGLVGTATVLSLVLALVGWGIWAGTTEHVATPSNDPVQRCIDALDDLSSITGQPVGPESKARAACRATITTTNEDNAITTTNEDNAVCEEFYGIAADATLSDEESAIQFGALARRTSEQELSAAIQEIADKFARHAEAISMEKVNTLC
jgi:hypothetical protein